jgi:hypothetical protein
MGPLAVASNQCAALGKRSHHSCSFNCWVLNNVRHIRPVPDVCLAAASVFQTVEQACCTNRFQTFEPLPCRLYCRTGMQRFDHLSDASVPARYAMSA